MRQYEPIWLRLKKRKVAELMVPANTVTTIVNMVQKEKKLDLGFKIMCGEEGITYRLSHKHDKKSGKLTFKLNRSYPLPTGDLDI